MTIRDRFRTAAIVTANLVAWANPVALIVLGLAVLGIAALPWVLS